MSPGELYIWFVELKDGLNSFYEIAKVELNLLWTHWNTETLKLCFIIGFITDLFIKLIKNSTLSNSEVSLQNKTICIQSSSLNEFLWVDFFCVNIGIRKAHTGIITFMINCHQCTWPDPAIVTAKWNSAIINDNCAFHLLVCKTVFCERGILFIKKQFIQNLNSDHDLITPGNEKADKVSRRGYSQQNSVVAFSQTTEEAGDLLKHKKNRQKQTWDSWIQLDRLIPSLWKPKDPKLI